MFEDGAIDFEAEFRDESPTVVDSNKLCSPGNNTNSNTSKNNMKKMWLCLVSRQQQHVPTLTTTTPITCCSRYICPSLCAFMFFSSTSHFLTFIYFLIFFYKYVMYASYCAQSSTKKTQYAHRKHLFEVYHSSWRLIRWLLEKSTPINILS